MPAFNERRRVRHTPGDMFDLVADVEAYPGFVPLCEGLVVRSRSSDGERQLLLATLTVGYKFIRESFTCRVTLDRANLAIAADYVDGPFKRLQNLWRFEAAGPSATDVHFAIDYEFRSRPFEALMGAVFDRAFRRFAEAFENRANQLYGAKTGRAPAAGPRLKTSLT